MKINFYKDINSYNLLAALVLFILVAIPITLFPDYGEIIFALTYSFLIIAGVGYATSQKRHFVLGYALGLLSFVLVWTSIFFYQQTSHDFAKVFSLFVFFNFIAFHLFRKIALQDEVSLTVLYAAISGYLVLGVIGGTLFQMLEIVIPGSFGIVQETGKDVLFELHYLSFITITTIGYGDITPANPAAKSLAIFVGLVGQVYLTVIVAIIIGKYLR